MGKGLSQVGVYLLEYYKKTEKFNPVKLYPYEEGCKIVDTAKKHNLVVGKAVNLFSDMLEKKAKKKELDQMIRYIIVAIDSYKHKLNIEKAAEELGFNKFYKKYHEVKTKETK